LDSAREFVAEVPCGNQRTLMFALACMANIFDLMREGLWVEAEDAVAKSLVAFEQAAYHHGNWQVAWLLTHWPEPPFRRMGAAPERDPMRPFARLAKPEWTTAATQYWKDVQTLNSVYTAPGQPPSRSYDSQGAAGNTAPAETPGRGGKPRKPRVAAPKTAETSKAPA
jgi:hypothetical protein